MFDRRSLRILRMMSLQISLLLLFRLLDLSFESKIVKIGHENNDKCTNDIFFSFEIT